MLRKETTREKSSRRFHIGWRTLKTAASVIIAMAIVEAYGATTSKLIFAMLGAMAAVQPTFKESLESCLTQIVGVMFGAVVGVLLALMPIPDFVIIGIGIVLVITLYNGLRIRFSPVLPCLIVVTICTAADIQPFTYAVGRIWDTAIGLAVGMLINTVIFPYDNSRQIHNTVESLDRELIRFLEELFDGDDILPDVEAMAKKIDDMEAQLKRFSNQKLIHRLRRQRQQVEVYQVCEGKARELISRMVVLSRMSRPGRLNEESRRLLAECGAEIRDQRVLDEVTETDVVTNYHIRQIIGIRTELLQALENDRVSQRRFGKKTKK